MQLRGRTGAGPRRTLIGGPWDAVQDVAQHRGRRTLNRRGRAFAEPYRCGATRNPKQMHPKPARPCSCGKDTQRGGPTNPNPAGPCCGGPYRCGATRNPNRHALGRSPASRTKVLILSTFHYFNLSTFQHFNIRTFSTFQHFKIRPRNGEPRQTQSKQHVEMLRY